MKSRKRPSPPPRDPHWLHSWDKVIGLVETSLCDRIEAVRPRVAPALDAALQRCIPDDFHHPLVVKVLRVTWPALLERVAAIRRHRDWQFESWGATTIYAFRHCEREARPLHLWVELVEDAVERLARFVAADGRAAA